VWEIIREFPVETLSSQFDIRHATVEGHRSWRFILHLLGSNIESLAVKDFTWKVDNRRAQIINVPLGEGLVDFDAYAGILRELDINVPITLHIEYPLLSSAEEHYSLLEKQKIMIRIIKKDVQFIRSLLTY
jgi:L-ribulose-5-phosphate 3-epimerase